MVIVLVGVTGCGKSSVGKQLAAQLVTLRFTAYEGRNQRIGVALRNKAPAGRTAC